MKITVSGPLGAGTTTLCRNLKKALEYPYVYGGQIFRDMAEEKGMTLEQFSELAEKDNKYDLELDRKMMDFAYDHKDVIAEGRLAGWFAHREKRAKFFKIWLDAPSEIRMERVAHRENESLDKTREKIITREQSETKRYKNIYGIDISDLSIYDLVVNNRDMEQEETLEFILSALKKQGLNIE